MDGKKKGEGERNGWTLPMFVFATAGSTLTN
jgi:hypothetical protein